MNKKWKLIDKIETLVNQWYVLHWEYDTGDEYWYEKIGNMTLIITLKNKYYDTRSKQNKYLSKDVLDRTFKNLIKTVNAETVTPPVTKELWYEDSLRWLYHHYPYGETDGSNVILINWRWQITTKDLLLL